MSLELTDSLQSFVDSASSQQGFVSTNEYVLHVLQKEQDRARVRVLIEEGEASPSLWILAGGLSLAIPLWRLRKYQD